MPCRPSERAKMFVDTWLAGASFPPMEIHNPAPAHVALGWKLPKRFDPVVAQARMDRRIANWEKAASDLISRGGADPEKGLFAPVTVLKGSQSLGKTVAVISAIKRIRKTHPTARGLYLTQTTDLGKEVGEKAEAIGIDVVRYLGRSQIEPGTEETMCRKHELAATVAALGLPVAKTLCRRKLDSGQIVECPFAQSCAYLAQEEAVKQPGLIIASQQYASIPIEVLKDVDYVIIDESFWQTMTAIRRVDLGRFLEHRSIGPKFRGDRKKVEEANYELGEAVSDVKAIFERARAEKRPVRISDFRARNWTKEYTDYLVGLEYSRVQDIALHPGQNVIQQESILKDAEAQEALAFVRVWKSIGTELATSRNGAFNSIRVVYGHRNPKTGELQNVIRCFYRRKTRFIDKPTLILDANADSHIIRKFYPVHSFYRIEAKWSEAVRLDQAHDTAMSMTALKNENHQNDIFNMGLFMSKRHAVRIKAEPDEKMREAMKPLIMTTKAVLDVFRDEGSLDDADFANLHCGNTRGKDGHKHSVAGGIIGRIQPSTDVLEDTTRCLMADSEEEIGCVEADEEGRNPLPLCQHLMVAKNGDRKMIEISYHPHWFVHRILLQIREAEVMQCLTRFRPIWRNASNPCELFAVTNIPLGIMPDRLFTRAEIMPDKFDMMWLAGFIPEASQDISDAFPSLFPTAGAVRVAAHRRPRRAYPVGDGSQGGALQSANSNKQQSVTTFRVSYERPLKKGSRAGSAWMDLLDDDTPDSIVARAKGYLPTAEDFTFVMVEPPAAPAGEAVAIEAANDTTGKTGLVTARRDSLRSRYGIRLISRATLLLAQASGEEPPWWHLVPKDFSRRVAA